MSVLSEICLNLLRFARS